MRRSLKAVGLAVFAVAIATSDADAAWKPFASGAMNISDQVSLARTSDGVLHVGWFQGASSVMQTPIAAGGSVGAGVPIVSGWASAGDPVLVAQGTGLTAFWPGSPTLETGNPQAGIDVATSGDGGRSWSVSPRAVSFDGFASVPAAAVAGGTFLQAFLRGGETAVHVGTDPGVPAAGGYGGGTNQALAVSSAGPALVARCPDGGFVPPVNPASGPPAGAAAKMPAH